MKPFQFLLCYTFPLGIVALLSQTDLLNDMPPCALSCLARSIANSSCSPTNETCACADHALQHQVRACVLQGCTIKEALRTQNISNLACGVPTRDRSSQFTIISTSFGIATAVVVVSRLVFKYNTSSGLETDDWLTALVALCGAPATVFNYYGLVCNGLGRDVWTLTDDQITNFVMYFWIGTLIYFWNMGLLKIVLLVFYLRVFCSTNLRRLLWASILCTGLYMCIYVFVVIFQCQPIDYYWKKWDREHEGTCLNINLIGWSYSWISIALDLWIFAIPLSQVRHLSLDWNKKVAVAAMFFVGTFVTIVGVIRLSWIIRFNTNSLNPTWDFFALCCWSTVEVNVGIICVSVPTLRLMISRAIGGFHESAVDTKLSTSSHFSIYEPCRRYLTKIPSTSSRPTIRHLGPAHSSDAYIATPHSVLDVHDVDHAYSRAMEKANYRNGIQF